MDDTKCGCGKEGRYTHINDGVETYACNKYLRCPTYDELKETHDKLYRKFMNVSPVTPMNAVMFDPEMMWNRPKWLNDYDDTTEFIFLGEIHNITGQGVFVAADGKTFVTQTNLFKMIQQ